MQKVSFKVLNIQPSTKKKGFVDVDIMFFKNKKLVTYTRKNTGNETLIDGCSVTFDEQYNVLSIERKYDTKGVIKADSTQVGQGNKIKGEIITEWEKEWEEAEPLPEDIKEIEKENTVHHILHDDIKLLIENEIPVMLVGEAGSGKNYVLEQIADDLEMDFFFSNSIQQEYKLTGFIDAGGTFHETEFYKACVSEKPCLFFLDEIDASIPEVLVLLNAAIANKYFEFPTGKITLDHVRFVAAGNTVGSGATDLYTGRLVLDQATLDRFAIVPFDYDRNIELHITNQNAELVDFVRDLRKEATNKGIRATFSYRCLTMVTKLETTNKMDLSMIIKIAVVKGLDIDTIQTLNPYGYTKYHEALKRLKAA